MRIGVCGAGAIGIYLGTRLSRAGFRVHMLARPALMRAREEIEAVDLAGTHARPSADLEVSDRPEVLKGCDIVLVTVKSADTARVGELLGATIEPTTPVLTLQNGLFNAARLRACMPNEVSAGIVSYNVYRDGAARVRQATTGKVIVASEAAARGVAHALERAGEATEVASDIDAVLAGKLLMNLNNGVCAATGMTIAASLRDRDARRCLAACMREGRLALRAGGWRIRSPLGLPLFAAERLLTFPDAIVLRVARKLVAADARARSSTLQDLDRGRATEISELNGAIVTLGTEHGVPTPTNTVIVNVIREHEAAVAAGDRPHFVRARELWRRVEP